MTFQRQDFNGLVHIKNCEQEERSWHFLKVGIETVLLANWYRPGATDHDGFVWLHAEIAEYFQECSGVLMAGDLNVHHKKWLRYSNDNTTVGTDLKAFCDFHGMSQLVREPTRNEYLLDLVITDICKCSVNVLPCIADHNALLVKLPMPEVLEKSIKREVWILEEADWKKLKEELGNYDWRQLHEGTAEAALDYFLEVLWLHLVRHIPRREIATLKSSHPWVSQRSKDAIAETNKRAKYSPIPCRS